MSKSIHSHIEITASSLCVLMLACFFLLSIPGIYATDPNDEWLHSVAYVTIVVSGVEEAVGTNAALQLANDHASLDPTHIPRKLTRDVFEFKLSGSTTPTVAINALRVQGLLVNPMYEYPSGGFIKYTDRVSVTFDPGMSIAGRDSAHAALGCRAIGQEREKSNRETVEIVTPNGRTTFGVSREYAAIPGCRLAVPEAFLPIEINSETPFAPDYRRLQWTFHNRGDSGGSIDCDIDAPYAWRITKGSDSVRVAVLDCSFCTHPDVLSPVPNVSYFDVPSGLDSSSYTCAPCEGATSPDDRNKCAHGNMVLGQLAAAHNLSGIDGLAPYCAYKAIRMCEGNTNCPDPADSSPGCSLDIANRYYADALRYSVNTLQASIIVQTTDWRRDTTLDDHLNPDYMLAESKEVLDSLRNVKGVAVFVAAGNFNELINDRGVIASNPNVFAIGATDRSDVRWAWSNHGPELDFMAPTGTTGTEGSSSCRLLGDEPTWDVTGDMGFSLECNGTNSLCRAETDTFHVCGAGGTSFAAPKVAGIAALVLSARPDFMDSADVGMALYNVLKASAEDKGDAGHDTLYGWGRVNAQRALALVSRRGDVNIDGEIDVLDVIQTVNTAFRGDLTTDYYGSLVDLNCDSTIDILDVVRSINVAFRGFAEFSDSTIAPSCFSVYPAGIDTRCDRPALKVPSDDAELAPSQDTFTWVAPPYWVTEAYFELYEAGEETPLVVETLGITIADTLFEFPGELDTGAAYTWSVMFDGVDCAQSSASRKFHTSGWSPAFAELENYVMVESADVNCGDTSVSVGFYLSNDVALSALIVPLEIRSVSGGAFFAGDLTAQDNVGRLNGKFSAYSSTDYLPEDDSGPNECGGTGFGTRGEFDEPDGLSPDGMLFIGVANDTDNVLPAGSDGEPGDGDPSIVLTFDIGLQPGVFEIDTTCVTPANHLAFVDASDWSNPRVIVPEFTKGVITVEGIGTLSGHVTGHDTLCCNVVLDGDVIIDTNASLTLLPGRTVTATAFHDTTNGGLEPDLVEIIVHGTLQIADGSTDPPLLTSDSGVIGSWYGIRMMPGSTVITGPGAQLEYAYIGVTLEQGAIADSVANLNIRECDLAGIWSFGSNIGITGNTIADIEEGYGICVWDADPLIRGNRITSCETGIDVLRSSATIRGNVIYGPGLVGINVSHFDELYYGLDTTWIVEDSVLGYFTGAHINSGLYGHCRIDSCELLSEYVSGGQSSYGIKAIQTSWGEVRYSKIQAFGTAGLHSYKSDFDLGRNGDQGYNDIQTDSTLDCEEFCIKRLVLHTGINSTDTLRAEGNWWDSVPPPSAWFNALVDRTPYLTSPPLGKIVADIQDVVAAPAREQLGQNYPNPFNPSTTVSFSLASPEKVTLIIYNTLGQQIKVLADAQYEPGSYQLTWDGRTEDGREAASGVYFYRLIAGEHIESRKMVLLK